MNEEANFCSQCGATVSSGTKCCSNCGYDLKNSSTQIPLNENEKVEADIDNPDHDKLSSGWPAAIIDNPNHDMPSFRSAVLIFLKNMLKGIRKGIKEIATDVVRTFKSKDKADELLKWKELLEKGAITQEEYDKAKRDLLG